MLNFMATFPICQFCSGRARSLHHHSNWPLSDNLIESSSEDIVFASPRCFQNLEWLLSDQHILKVRYPTFEISEDCLYLNIYAPVPARENSKLPVRLLHMGLQLVGFGLGSKQGGRVSGIHSLPVELEEYHHIHDSDFFILIGLTTLSLLGKERGM